MKFLAKKNIYLSVFLVFTLVAFLLSLDHSKKIARELQVKNDLIFNQIVKSPEIMIETQTILDDMNDVVFKNNLEKKFIEWGLNLDKLGETLKIIYELDSCNLNETQRRYRETPDALGDRTDASKISKYEKLSKENHKAFYANSRKNLIELFGDSEKADLILSMKTKYLMEKVKSKRKDIMP